MKKGGLRVRITMLLNCIFTVLLILMAAAACYVAAVNYTNRNDQVIQTKIDELNSRLGGWIGEKTRMMSIIADEITARGYDVDKETLRAFLKDRAEGDADVFDCYASFEDKTTYFASDFVPPADFDPTVRGWYTSAVAADGVIITDPYTDVQTGKMVITCAQPIKKDGKVIGVAGMDMYIDRVIELVNGLEISEGGYAVLTTGSHNIIVHPDETLIPVVVDGNDVFTDYTTIVENYDPAAAAEGITSIKDSYGVKAKYTELATPVTGWLLGYTVPDADYYDQVYAIIKLFSVLTVLMCALSTTIVVISMRGTFRPLKRFAKEAERVTRGELDVAFGYEYDDEIGALCGTIENNNYFIKQYIDDIALRLDAMSKGNFDVESNVNYVGDYVKIKESLDNIAEELGDVFNGIEGASTAVFGGAEGVSEGANSLARSVSEQTALISEIVDGINAVSEKVNTNVNHTDDARKIARDTEDIVAESSQQMEQLLAAMKDIAKSSEEIRDIIVTIEDIAFQTNILALNASVEAARAGAAGKGFAVVADEVRNLAGKSSKASEQTAQLIEHSAQAVENGMRYADSASDALKRVVKQSSQIDDIIADINDESHEQRNYIDNVTVKINKVADYISSSASTAEESAAASQELNSQASALKNMLNRFK
ncbi:MAG: methyl-accepting chemotaxis protein [Oscillospiraceae bacterium]|nr:methyl-accepting chemotaxis protein [Oscillospiraceae bacterium]